MPICPEDLGAPISNEQKNCLASVVCQEKTLNDHALCVSGGNSLLSVRGFLR